MTEDARLADRLLAGAVWLAAAAVIGVFLWLLTDLLREGASALSFRFLVDEPRDAGRAGGIAPILVSTLLILGVCLTVALPLSLCCAAYLAEYTRREDRAGRTVRVSLEVLAGMPSIVFGLFRQRAFLHHPRPRILDSLRRSHARLHGAAADDRRHRGRLPRRAGRLPQRRGRAR
ncbi:MAG: hypothetical protein ACREXU_02725, partial [Gammaproteobacteria bacterium]